jgi:GH24 family phage-related lysozyme (muramidase)
MSGLTGNAITNALRDAGIVHIRIVPWELDEGELGIEIEWGGGQLSSFRVPVPNNVKERLTRKPLAVDIQTLSDEGYKLIRHFESLRLLSYHDDAGYPTIGYGHLLLKEKWADLSQWPAITEEEADDLLGEDVAQFERAVACFIRVPLSQGQFDALVSFSFNLGAGALRTSTLRRVLNQGHYYQVPHELRRWVFADGQKLRGLVRRREAEVVTGQPWQAP